MEPADLVLKNAEVFHVYTGEFILCDIAILPVLAPILALKKSICRADILRRDS